LKPSTVKTIPLAESPIEDSIIATWPIKFLVETHIGDEYVSMLPINFDYFGYFEESYPIIPFSLAKMVFHYFSFSQVSMGYSFIVSVNMALPLILFSKLFESSKTEVHLISTNHKDFPSYNEVCTQLKSLDSFCGDDFWKEAHSSVLLFNKLCDGNDLENIIDRWPSSGFSKNLENFFLYCSHLKDNFKEFVIPDDDEDLGEQSSTEEIKGIKDSDVATAKDDSASADKNKATVKPVEFKLLDENVGEATCEVKDIVMGEVSSQFEGASVDQNNVNINLDELILSADHKVIDMINEIEVIYILY
jgi:hypothetical protein